MPSKPPRPSTLGLQPLLRLLTLIALVCLASEARAQTPGVFQVEIDGVTNSMFTSCSGLGSEQEVIEQKIIGEGGVEIVRKIPGRLRFSDLVCTRAVSTDTSLAVWRKQVEDGGVVQARKAVSVTLLDQSATPIASWTLANAWPIELRVVGGVEVIRIASEATTRSP